MFLARLNQTHFYAREHQLITIIYKDFSERLHDKRKQIHEIVEEQLVNCNVVSSP